MIDVDVIESVIKAALTAAFLNSQTQLPTVTIDSMPEEPTPEKYRLLGIKSCCLVQHGAITYNTAVRGPFTEKVVGQRIKLKQTTSVMSMVTIGARSMRQAKNGGHHGAIDILRTTRIALAGLVVGFASGGNPIVLVPKQEIYLDRIKGVYWYRILFEHTDTFESTESPST